jgi:hypothetical protein
MKLVESKKGIRLPILYYVNSREEAISLPLGLPYIIGSSDYAYNDIVRFLEFNILWKAALATGLAFNWKKILKDKGYSGFNFKELAISANCDSKRGYRDMKDVDLMDASYIVDIDKLKELELIPSFLDDISKAIEINLFNSYKFDETVFNKKLGLPLGDLVSNPQKKNLIIIDISGSIPTSISKTILALSRTMSEQFHADLLITGSKSTVYPYNEVDSLDVANIYKENGTDNDQLEFLKLIREPESYGTVICFGDNHHPGMQWNNSWNRKGVRSIDPEEGKEKCVWEVDKIISFHTTSNVSLAGYAAWFTCDDTTYIKDWVTYFNK